MHSSTLWGMSRNVLKLTSVVVCILLCACAGGSGKNTGLTPLPSVSSGPPDSALAPWISGYIAQTGGPANTQYDYTRIDMNADGRRDALILFKAPYTTWCGWTGCMMLILKAQGDTFELVSEIEGVRGPLIVTKYKTNGWSDLGLRVSGAQMPDRTVILRFDGRGYPGNPAGQASVSAALSDIPGVRVFP